MLFDPVHTRRQLRFSSAYVEANFPAVNQSMGAVPVAQSLSAASPVTAFLPAGQGAGA